MRNTRTDFRAYIISIIAVMIITVALVIVIMRPPMNELMYLALLLGITTLGSALIGYVSYRFGWWRQLRSVRLTLILGYVLAAGLTLFNVWVTARLMFINEHDLALASLLLLFAGGISVSFGYFFSNSIEDTIRRFVEATKLIKAGDLSTRVEVEGQNEFAELSETFNSMTARLEEVEEAKLAFEEMRRDLIAWVSHDLRTPLSSLSAMLDALADGVVTDEATVQRYFQQGQEEIGRMSRLIDDLFELAQLDAGNLDFDPQLSPISDLISDTLGSFAARAQSKRVEVAGSVSPEVGLVWMAPDKINRVLNNLLENAIRHTPEGGQVSIEVQNDSEAVVVSVADNGEGIAKEDLPRVFDRFYRIEKSRSRDRYEKGGAGLGLAIAKGLVEAHGGEIWAESEVGSGTRMRFSLLTSAPLQAV